MNGPLFARHLTWFWGAQKTHRSSQSGNVNVLASTHVRVLKKIKKFVYFVYLFNGHIVSSRDFGPPLQPIVAQLYVDRHAFIWIL